jgi:sulfite exporter TauE/SafE/copper chaperone CopZ
MEHLIQEKLRVDGMTCAGCERRIEKGLRKLAGVVEVKAFYESSEVIVTYDTAVVDLGAIIQKIDKLDYRVKGKSKSKPTAAAKKASQDNMPLSQFLGIGIVVFALYMIIKNTIGFNFIPQVNKSMGYGILFVIGLITSIHCLAMCGGINLSQCVSQNAKAGDRSNQLAQLKPSFLYNIGRVISYTIVGGIVGALGSLVSFSGTAKGIVALFAGAFMVIIRLNMLNIFPWLKKVNIRPPRPVANFLDRNSDRGPFFVGLLNGLMPCGPLQAMQLYAMGTGSFLAGATSMLVFSLGTVPLMFGLGAVSTLLSSKFTHRMMKVSAVLVMVLGIIMLSRGLNLSGVNTAYASPATSNVSKVQGSVQIITTSMTGGNYSPIIVQKGIPVVWTIKAQPQDLTGCNNPMTIPTYNIKRQLQPGDNVIKFTPTKEGTITYTCWMGMTSSTIMVVPDVKKITSKDWPMLKVSNLPARRAVTAEAVPVPHQGCHRPEAPPIPSR